jgi:radical SAM modification target selenobiotic family peptide
MEKDQMKSILAGMGIASLVACMAAVPINAQGASG